MLYIKQKPAKNAGFKHLLQFDFGNSSRHLTMFEVGVFLLGLLDKTYAGANGSKISVVYNNELFSKNLATVPK
jgi:hypothetical protein